MANKRDTPIHKDGIVDTLNFRYERTQRKISRISSFGYEVIEIWECEFNNNLINNPEMKYLKTHHLLKNTP